jgi:hypothetical protein
MVAVQRPKTELFDPPPCSPSLIPSPTPHGSFLPHTPALPSPCLPISQQVELKTGEMYRGELISGEDNWNCQVRTRVSRPPPLFLFFSPLLPTFIPPSVLFYDNSPLRAMRLA